MNYKWEDEMIPFVIIVFFCWNCRLVKFRDCDFHELSEEIPAGSVCLLFHIETGTIVREESIVAT